MTQLYLRPQLDSVQGPKLFARRSYNWAAVHKMAGCAPPAPRSEHIIQPPGRRRGSTPTSRTSQLTNNSQTAWCSVPTIA